MSDDTATTTDDAVADVDSTPEVDDADEPKFTLKEVQKLKKEAQSVRDDRRRAVNAAVAEAQATMAEEYKSKYVELDKFAELEQAKTQAELELMKFRTVLEADVPTELVLDLVALVQGYDEESISESVSKLKTVMGHQARDRAVDPTQSSGNALPLNGDPLLATMKRIVGI